MVLLSNGELVSLNTVQFKLSNIAKPPHVPIHFLPLESTVIDFTLL